MRTKIILAAILTVAAASTAMAGSRGGSSKIYEWNYETSGPAKGYEGFSGIGASSYYCSYIRTPNRECKVTSSGKERCKIVSWNLKQTCY